MRSPSCWRSRPVSSLDFWRSLALFCLAPLYISSSKTSAVTTTANTTNNLDKRLVASQSAIGLSSDNSTVSVQVLDGGAIAGAVNLAKQTDLTAGKNLASELGFASSTFSRAASSLDAAGTRNADAYTKSLGFAGDLFGKAFGALDKSAGLVQSAYSESKGDGTQKQLLTVAAIGAVVIVATASLKK